MTLYTEKVSEYIERTVIDKAFRTSAIRSGIYGMASNSVLAWLEKNFFNSETEEIHTEK